MIGVASKAAPDKTLRATPKTIAVLARLLRRGVYNISLQE
jgi:hypothetical protein